MERLLQSVRDHPAVAGVAVFLAISTGLALLFSFLILRSGGSLKPLVFFFGFIAIVGGPQAAVHLLDALAQRRTHPLTTDPAPTAVASPSLQVIPWDRVFGPEADPSLIIDAKLGLGDIVGKAEDARIAFSSTGETALAARFTSPEDAAQALNRYGTFFRFAQVAGSDRTGWTAKRYEGQGEWNHVATAGPELYAWSGSTREGVIARRVTALGPWADPVGEAHGTRPASATEVSSRLAKNPRAMTAFVVLNLLFAVGWFFKASAWSARVTPPVGTAQVDALTLRQRLQTLADVSTPLVMAADHEGRTLEITWRYADARWFDHARLHGLRRAHKLVLEFDEPAHKVRVREFWSNLDASAGADGLRFHWQAATGMQFFQFEHRRIIGAQLDPEGRPTGKLSSAYTFNLQELKAPIIETVLREGWTWQPVMWNSPASFRWLTE